MGDATTANGDMPHSQTLDHFLSYHIVNDGIDVFKNNPYGQKSIELSNVIYNKFLKPTFPYLETPATYAKPYALKIDEFGNLFLTKVDERVPIVKSETKDIKETVLAYVQWPVDKASDTKSWVFNIYSEEYKKCGGDGFVAGGKALITSSLVLTSETLNWLSSVLATKKAEAKEAAQEASEKASE